MAKLSAASIAAIYTADEIKAKITEYQTALDNAASGAYRLGTTQGEQSGTPPSPEKIGEILEVYMQAYRIATGQGYVRVIHADYHPQGGFA